MNRNGILVSVIIAIIGLSLLAYAVVQHRYTVSAPRTLNLSELGLSLTIPGTLSDLTYVAREQDKTGTMLHTYIARDCEIGSFYVLHKGEIATSGTAWTQESLEQYSVPQGEKPAPVKVFTDFYLVFEANPNPCTVVTKDEQAKRQTDVLNALTTARYMGY